MSSCSMGIIILIKRKYPSANVSVIVPAKQPPPLQVPMSNMFNKKANELGIKYIKDL